MHSSALLFIASTSIAAAVQSPSVPPQTSDPFTKLHLSANGISADFIPYGARLTNLLVRDKNQAWQDVAVGYDDGASYLHDTESSHTYFGAVVGRYANRIKNGTFTVDGKTSHVSTNEHAGANTLHGGYIGYDQANWTVVSHSSNSLTLSFYDQHLSGFPGDVLNFATYTLSDDASFTSRLVSIAVDKATPIMLSHHIYWNLGAYVDQDAITILDNTLYMPFADRVIDTDGILVPNGTISTTKDTVLDFTKPGTALRDRIPNAVGTCGTNCIGIDNAFINDRSPYASQPDPGVGLMQLWSPSTGIQMSVTSNQAAAQVYTCNGQNGTIPVKQSQQHQLHNTTFIEKYGCFVFESQDWIDGVNHPEWGRDSSQIFSPTSLPAVNYAKFQFSVQNETRK